MGCKPKSPAHVLNEGWEKPCIASKHVAHTHERERLPCPEDRSRPGEPTRNPALAEQPCYPFLDRMQPVSLPAVASEGFQEQAQRLRLLVLLSCTLSCSSCRRRRPLHRRHIARLEMSHRRSKMLRRDHSFPPHLAVASKTSGLAAARYLPPHPPRAVTTTLHSSSSLIDVSWFF